MKEHEPEVALSLAKSHAFCKELQDLMGRHHVHAAWCSWISEEPISHDDRSMKAQVSTMGLGCMECSMVSVAAGIVGMKKDVRKVLSDKLSDLLSDNTSIKSLIFEKDDTNTTH